MKKGNVSSVKASLCSVLSDMHKFHEVVLSSHHIFLFCNCSCLLCLESLGVWKSLKNIAQNAWKVKYMVVLMYWRKQMNIWEISYLELWRKGSRSFCLKLFRPEYEVILPENRRCVNIPRSKKGAHKHKYKCVLSVWAKRLHTSGKISFGSRETTLGEQDIGQNYCDSEKDMKTWLIVAVMHTTYAAVKLKPPDVIYTLGHVNRKGRTCEVHTVETRRNRAVHERNLRGSRMKTWV